MNPTYTIKDGQITCLLCNRTSNHPRDVAEKYCGSCHVFHDDLPANPHARPRLQVVGLKCTWCDELITDEDRGTVIPRLASESNALQHAPFHRECLMRSIAGSVQHQQHRCTCYDENAPDEEAGLSRREAARRAVAYFYNGKP